MRHRRRASLRRPAQAGCGYRQGRGDREDILSGIRDNGVAGVSFFNLL